MANLGDIISALFGKPRALSTMDQKIQALTDIVGELHSQVRGLSAHLNTMQEHHDTLTGTFQFHRHGRYADPDYPHRYTTSPPLGEGTEEPE